MLSKFTGGDGGGVLMDEIFGMTEIASTVDDVALGFFDGVGFVGVVIASVGASTPRRFVFFGVGSKSVSVLWSAFFVFFFRLIGFFVSPDFCCNSRLDFVLA